MQAVFLSQVGKEHKIKINIKIKIKIIINKNTNKQKTTNSYKLDPIRTAHLGRNDKSHKHCSVLSQWHLEHRV